MYTLFVFVALVAAVFARPGGQLVSVSQDTLGNYNLKYAIDGISRTESRNIHGDVAGGFSYIDPHGIVRALDFTSGIHGYNAVGADIPVPVHDTPEVAHAKAAHLSVLRAAELAAPPQPLELVEPHLFEVPQIPIVKSLPVAIAAPFQHVPVHSFVHGGIPETPEVLAARAEHFAAHAAVRANLLHH